MSASVLLLLVLVVLAATQDAPLVSRECLGCICEASSSCDVNRGCRNGVCGPFLIGRGFWVDSELGRESAYSQQTFETCAGDTFCSAAIIRKYMAKYPYDCNQDGKKSCSDHAMIHKAGPGGCLANQASVRQTQYWRKLQACLANYPNA